MDCSPPGSPVHGILQARILEWVAISFSRVSSQPRDQTRVSCIVGRHFHHLSPQKDLYQHTTTPRTDVFSVLHPTAGHCRPTPPPRLLDSHRQVWFSLLWGHCSFLLGPGAQGSVCVLQEQQVVTVWCWSWQVAKRRYPMSRVRSGSCALLYWL